MTLGKNIPGFLSKHSAEMHGNGKELEQKKLVAKSLLFINSLHEREPEYIFVSVHQPADVHSVLVYLCLLIYMVKLCFVFLCVFNFSEY